MPGRPGTDMSRSTTIPPLRACCTGKFASTGVGRTPALQTIVAVGTVVPLLSAISTSSMRVTGSPITISTPREARFFCVYTPIAAGRPASSDEPASINTMRTSLRLIFS